MHAAVLRHLYQAGLSPAQTRPDPVLAAMPAQAPVQARPVEKVLARSDLFCHLEPAELLARPAARRRRVAAGAVVVRQGDAGSSLFIVVEGLLDVEIGAPEGPARGARRLAPRRHVRRDSLLTGAPRSATVTARTESVLFEITKVDLEPILTRCPELAQAMSATLAAREAERPRLAAEAIEPPPPPPLDEQGLLGRIRGFFGLPHHPS